MTVVSATEARQELLTAQTWRDDVTAMEADQDTRDFIESYNDHMNGTIDAIAWALGDRLHAPIKGDVSPRPSNSRLVTEQMRAEDVVERAEHRSPLPQDKSHAYALGVVQTIEWLLDPESAVRPTKSY